MTGEEGSWVVDSNTEDTGVVIAFAHLGEEGVETFETAMPPDRALEFGQAVMDCAKDMLGEND